MAYEPLELSEDVTAEERLALDTLYTSENRWLHVTHWTVYCIHIKSFSSHIYPNENTV